MRLTRRRWSRPGQVSRQSWAHIARKLSGPLYAAAGAGAAYQGGFGHSGSGRRMQVSVTVRHVRLGGELDVETSNEPPWGDEDYQDWRLASDWIDRALPPGRLPFPLSIAADRWEQDVPVDGVPVRFVFVGSSDVWTARGHVGERQVVVGASGWPVDGLALVATEPGEVSYDVPHGSPHQTP
jgi:hypothetical protein